MIEPLKIKLKKCVINATNGADIRTPEARGLRGARLRKTVMYLKYFMIENTDDYVVYGYYPEGSSNYGTIRVNKHTSEIEELKKASDNEASKFFGHLYHNRILKFIETGEYRTDGMVAWG